MPTYEYECEKCQKVHEEIRRIADRDEEVICECGGRAKKIISAKGAIFTDGNVIWMPSVVDQMKPDYDKRPIETRTELKSYLKDNGLIWTG